MSIMMNNNNSNTIAMGFLLAVICMILTASAVLYRKNKQATRIQALARGYLARKEIKRASVAAAKIQTQWRRYAAVKKNESATKIQAIARGYMARAELSRAHDAASKIQAAWRVHHAKKVESVTRIQAFVRTFIAMKGLRIAVTAATEIQRQWRIVFSKTTNAVTRIQGFVARQKLQVLKFVHQCTKVVRSVPLSEHTAMPSLRSFQNTWETLMIFIASVIFWPVLLYRRYQKNQREERLYLEITSALLIQKRWRQWAARKDAERKTWAASLIQTQWRGFAQRSEYKLRMEGLRQQRKFWEDKLPIERTLLHCDFYLTLTH